MAKNGLYKFGLTIRIDLTVRIINWWTYVLDIDDTVKIRCTRYISITIGPTIAENSQYKAKLAEKYHFIPKGKTKVRVSTQEKILTKKEFIPLYAESINMMV